MSKLFVFHTNLWRNWRGIPEFPPLSQDYQWYSRCYTCVMTSMQIKPSSSWSVPIYIYIYLWWLVTATSTDLSHHLKYFYCVYFDGRPSNSCVIHLAGQDVLYLMQLYTRSSVFEIEIQGADMYFTNNSDNNVQTTSV